MNNSLKILLTEIIDYAGLFPPSELPMSVAVKNFSQYIKGENSWMLGRFVVPVARLDEFSGEAATLFTKKYPWRISLLASGNLEKTLKKVAEFNQANLDKATIDTLEIKVENAVEIAEAQKLLPAGVRAFFEIPHDEILTDFITALAISKLGAKIRTGGITQDAFPSTDAIIKFMRICIAANIPFKATAGLHHPLRCTKPLTYADDAPKGLMHGFLNLFLSACFLRQDLNSSAVHLLMNETVASRFTFSEEGITWNGRTISHKEISLTRLKNAISFGSCSFLEPVEDLQNLEIF
jgi:hypothetical protein